MNPQKGERGLWWHLQRHHRTDHRTSAVDVAATGVAIVPYISFVDSASVVGRTIRTTVWNFDKPEDNNADA